MLKLEQIKLKNNMLLIEQYEVEITPIAGGITRDPKDVEHEKSLRRFRIGQIIGNGAIDNDIIRSLLQSALKAKVQQPETTSEKITPVNLTPKSTELLINKNVLFDASVIDVFDVPLENFKPGKVILVDANYLIGLIEEDKIIEIID